MMQAVEKGRLEAPGKYMVQIAVSSDRLSILLYRHVSVVWNNNYKESPSARDFWGINS